MTNSKIRDHVISQTRDTNDVINSIQQRAVSSNLPIWTFYRRGSNYVIPYVISHEIGQLGRKAIKEAARDLRRHTCIRLEPRRDQLRHVRYFDAGDGCYSTVGATDVIHQISLSPPCWNKGTVLHETLHALGFWHEHSRPDRDNYVTIVTENVVPELQFNFAKFNSFEINSFRSEYDVNSVMQYGSFAFSRNGRPTMVDRKSGRVLKTQRREMSKRDIEQLNLLYKCPQATIATTSAYPVVTTGYQTGPWSPGATVCLDRHSFCFMYAINGRCWSKSIQSLCCVSCRLNRVTKSRCDDVRSDCSYWKGIGACESAPIWMKKNCCSTCQSKECLDHVTSCSMFATSGYCYGSYPEFMKIKCQKSCGLC